MAITNRKNWEIIKDNEVYGVQKKNLNQLNNVKIGDNIVFFCQKRDRSGSRTIKFCWDIYCGIKYVFR